MRDIILRILIYRIFMVKMSASAYYKRVHCITNWNHQLCFERGIIRHL